MSPWPEWWDWDLELTPHLEKRMEERGLDELGLRTLLHAARRFRPDTVPGRFAIEGGHERRRWEVIVEPDEEDEVLVVVTAYPLD